jgi:hypothetical protein
MPPARFVPPLLVIRLWLIEMLVLAQFDGVLPVVVLAVYGVPTRTPPAYAPLLPSMWLLEIWTLLAPPKR